MSAKKRRYKPKPFESTGKSSDTSANIYNSMLHSESFRDLTARQKVLYMCMKSEYYAQKGKPEGYDETAFYFNKAKWRKDSSYSYQIYSNGSDFKKDVDALEEHGFIKVIIRAQNMRERNIYRFSDGWQSWEPRPP